MVPGTIVLALQVSDLVQEEKQAVFHGDCPFLKLGHVRMSRATMAQTGGAFRRLFKPKDQRDGSRVGEECVPQSLYVKVTAAGQECAQK